MSGLDLSGSLHRRRRTGRIVVIVLILAAGVAAGVWWLLNQPDPPEPAVDAFAAAWTAGDPSDGPVADAGRVGERYAEIVAGLDEAPVEVSVRTVTPDPEDGGRVTAALEVAWTLPGDRDWSYPVDVTFTLEEEGWLAEVTDEVVHPQLPTGGTLDARRTRPPRADVVDVTGEPIVTDRPVVDVGIQPSRIEDLDDTVDAVRDALDLELGDLPDRIEAAGEDQFVPVATLRRPDYDEVRDDLQPIPGTVFRERDQALAPTAEFARPTLGQVREVTAEMIEQQPERFVAGDLAGTSGLQAAYDEQLGGRPGLEVVAVPPEGDDAGEGEDAGPDVLFTAEPEEGEPLTVTLDLDVQRAADAVLADQTEFPTAIVAVRISDGHLVAVANGPANGGLDLALAGRYSPGSTFKVVTTAALIEDGFDPGAEVGCPATATVDGFSFSNAEDAALGDVPFAAAFAQSCNTAFVGLAGDLAPEALHEAATAFGMGDEDVDLGVPAFTGDVPVTESATEQGAAGIGQGRILASPFSMAQVAATAARGAYLPATLVVDPEAGVVEPTPLPDAVAGALPPLMREVVTDGSGSALEGVPGDPVAGKTGTAEYGDESPPRTHAWFIGSQGDLAFAVLVAETEDSYGGQVAAPIAAELLEQLAG